MTASGNEARFHAIQGYLSGQLMQFRGGHADVSDLFVASSMGLHGRRIKPQDMNR